MIDHIDIREIVLDNDPRVILAITIHLKLNGYAPKYSLEYLKNMRTEEKQKASHSKNDLLNGGGEGAQQAAKFVRSARHLFRNSFANFFIRQEKANVFYLPY